MRYIILFVSCIAGGFVMYTPSQWSSKDTKKSHTSHTNLVWSDEFNYEGHPDPALWNYDVGKGCDQPCGCGWGNNELQNYTKDNLENVRVEDGRLLLELHRQIDGTITSGKIHTKRKAHWKNGTIEVRAKTAQALGTWSAIWMMPAEDKYGSWPKSGEIDIMEHVGYDPENVWSAAHVEKYNGMNGLHKNGVSKVTNTSDEFHIYKLVWTEDHYETYIDDKLNFRYTNEHKGSSTWPYDQDFYVILNLAFGGNWGGKKGIDIDALPVRMEVDYVRVYQ